MLDELALRLRRGRARNLQIGPLGFHVVGADGDKAVEDVQLGAGGAQLSFRDQLTA